MSERGRVTFVGHSTVLIELDGVRVLTDPVLRGRIGPLLRRGDTPEPSLGENVDAVLISHLHRDHADLPSLRRLDPAAQMFAPPGAAGFLERLGFSAVSELAPGESGRVGGITVTAVEARHRGGHRLFSRARQPVGFTLAGGLRLYFAGDTDLFDGMRELGPDLDLALLPVWGWGPTLGPGHLNPERAARAAALLSPRVVIPIHWGTLFPAGLAHLAPGRLESPPHEFARWAQRLAPQVEVRLLAPGETTSLP
jgi:L-ascorbate metabolism protein UlaG (beta-lactamase superfamily)